MKPWVLEFDGPHQQTPLGHLVCRFCDRANPSLAVMHSSEAQPASHQDLIRRRIIHRLHVRY